MRIRKLIMPAGAVLLLASCGGADSDPGPGGVSNSDAKALDQAAQKLDKRQQPPAPK